MLPLRPIDGHALYFDRHICGVVGVNLHPEFLPGNCDLEGFWIAEEPGEWPSGFFFGCHGSEDRHSKSLCQRVLELDLLHLEFVGNVVLRIIAKAAARYFLDEVVRGLESVGQGRSHGLRMLR